MLSVSVVTVAYNSGHSLSRLLDSLGAQEGLLETIVVNNGDRGPEVVEAEARKGVRVVEPKRNVGFAGGCNLGAAGARGEVIVFLNPDTVVAESALLALAEAVCAPGVGIAMARLRLLDRPELLNSGGNIVHVTGLAWAGHYGEPAERVSERAEIPFASGAAMAIRSDLFYELGGFCDRLFMYQEDLELSWRARLAGLSVVIEPKANIYHDYDFARHADKHYLLERNRLVFVLTTYSLRLLVLLAPVFVVSELGLVALAAKDRWLGDKVAGWAWLAKNGGWVVRRRWETQRRRVVGDRAVAPYLTALLDPQMIALPHVSRFANPLLKAYWRGSRKLL
jgi:GT2 family glycosyltransferase